MAVFSVIGETLFTPEDLVSKTLAGEIKEIAAVQKSSLGSHKRDLGFAGTVDNGSADRKFTPIGIGKPLSVEIACVYSGKYDRFLWGKKDAMVVSGVRNAQTFQATSRAINLQVSDVKQNSYLEFTALEDGTPIVFYTPAMDADSMLVSFEIMFDNFDESLFGSLSSLLSASAGIPVFMPAAGYLLGASQLVKIGSSLGDVLFSGEPNLKGTISIQLKSPLIPPTEPSEYVIYNDNDRMEFANLKVAMVNLPGRTPMLRLVDDSNKEYSGPAPYIIVLLDGAERQGLSNFAQTIASASLLKKFYGSEDKTGQITTVLQDAMQLYNDSTYRNKAEKLKQQLGSLKEESEEYKSLKSLYDAYVKNIQNDSLKLVEPHVEHLAV
jgi:hypothetical protein